MERHPRDMDYYPLVIGCVVQVQPYHYYGEFGIVDRVVGDNLIVICDGKGDHEEEITIKYSLQPMPGEENKVEARYRVKFVRRFWQFGDDKHPGPRSSLVNS